jgi:hypothetical protein
MSLHLQPICLATSSDDSESQLVFSDDCLVAVLVRLSEFHEEDAGMWYLEAGFGMVRVRLSRMMRPWLRRSCSARLTCTFDKPSA